MMKLKKLTKTETILLVNYAMAVVLSAAVAIRAFISADISTLATLAVSWVTETAVFSGFYCWKAKNENRQKYAQKWAREISEKMPPEMAARFAEIVLKE